MTIVNSDLCQLRLDRIEDFQNGIAQLSEAARKKAANLEALRNAD